MLVKVRRYAVDTLHRVQAVGNLVGTLLAMHVGNLEAQAALDDLVRTIGTRLVATGLLEAGLDGVQGLGIVVFNGHRAPLEVEGHVLNAVEAFEHVPYLVTTLFASHTLDAQDSFFVGSYHSD